MRSGDFSYNSDSGELILETNTATHTLGTREGHYYAVASHTRTETYTEQHPGALLGAFVKRELGSSEDTDAINFSVDDPADPTSFA